jgi:hypothetical protein
MTMQSAIGQTLIPQMDPSDQYRFAAGEMFPGYQDRPYLNRYMSRLQQPLYGQYLTGWGGMGKLDEFANPELGGFGGWLQTGGLGQYGRGQFGQPMGWAQSVGPRMGTLHESGQTVYADPHVAAPGSWANIIATARAMGSGETGVDDPWAAQGISRDVYDRWSPMLGEAEMAGGLASLATYDPMAGSVFGKLRQAGLQRAQDRFMQDRLAGRSGYAKGTATTPADWLDYITKTGGLAGRAYQVNPYQGGT